jgi:L-aminopeptidase/D-esterase-like protein
MSGVAGGWPGPATDRRRNAIIVKNLLTDVPGLRVGNADDARLKSGVTVVLCDEPAIASGHVMGGAPGTRDTDLLAPEQTIGTVDAVVLSGGSAFGLESASGIMSGLAEAGRGVAIGPARVPIVPAAILFDLINGGDKDWGAASPYPALGRAALAAASTDFALGSVGAGAGATTVNLKGGLGSAAMRLDTGITVAALVAVNALGQATIGDTAHFWAAPFERDGEFGGLGLPAAFPAEATALRHKGQATGASTTIAVVATDARLSKAEAKRLAVMTHDGFARALWPSHTPMDGDIVFALATGRATAPIDMIAIGAAGAAVMARAIARAIYEATPAAGDLLPTWHQKFRSPGREHHFK